MNAWDKLKDKVTAMWDYASGGVWADTRTSKRVTFVKTLNLSVRTFFDGNVQTQACAMTYQTMLALVPALALLLAIARGFGFQTYVEQELYTLFPAQKTAIQYAWNFVDSYLNQASEGIFVGVGIVFLLYTLISLIISTEDTFNAIWGIKQGRSIWRKISDYTALLLILPVLIICVSGLNLIVNSTIDKIFSVSFVTPVISWVLEVASWLLTCLFFTAAYIMFPNTRVRFRNAIIPGIFAGIGFLIVQWLFVTGQMYVSRYNAIYGSFSFLPLLLIWMQLVWMITLAGAVICYSSSNIFRFSFDDEIRQMSPEYRRKVYVAVATIVTQRFGTDTPYVSEMEIISKYDIPVRLVSDICSKLKNAGIFALVAVDPENDTYAYQLSVPQERMTLAYLLSAIEDQGPKDFIPEFDKNFKSVNEAFHEFGIKANDLLSKINLTQLKIK